MPHKIVEKKSIATRCHFRRDVSPRKGVPCLEQGKILRLSGELVSYRVGLDFHPRC